jgi:hypothetical protein
VHRVAVHRLLGDRNVREEFVQDGPRLETWRRLHAPSEIISPSDLEVEVERFRSLFIAAHKKLGSLSPVARYRSGVIHGLVSSERVFVPKITLHARPILIERLAEAECDLMLTNSQIPNSEGVIDLEYCLGNLVGLERALGHRTSAPAEIPPMGADHFR